MLRSRSQRWTAPHPGVPGAPTERGEDAVATAYEQGSCPALSIPAPSADHLRLLSRLVGRMVTVEEFATWERVRAFAGYAGPRQVVEADRALAPSARPASATSATTPARAAVPPGIDPHDLGDG